MKNRRDPTYSKHVVWKVCISGCVSIPVCIRIYQVGAINKVTQFIFLKKACRSKRYPSELKEILY